MTVSPRTAAEQAMSANPRLGSNLDPDFYQVVQGHFQLRKLLGKGSYGSVYDAIALENNCLKVEPGTRVAIKVVRNAAKEFPTINAKRLLREICILRSFNHPNIMRFRGLLPPKDVNNLRDLYMVADYVVTDLHKILQSSQPLSKKHVQFITYQILKGIQIMHHNEIIHRDIKPANILIDERVRVRICDFGLARSVSVNPRIEQHLRKVAKMMANGKHDHQDHQHCESTKGGYNHGALCEIDTLHHHHVNGDMTHTHVDTDGKECKTLSHAYDPHHVNIGATATTLAEGEDGGVIPPKPMVRQMTHHVVTRWYRAPELILQSSVYTAAIDIWSIGCILAELIAMHLSRTHREPLFPGDYCFPLSPLARNSSRRIHVDQLASIFNVIGTPSREEVMRSFPSETKIHEYVARFEPRPRISWTDKYPNADPLALDLLDKMLKFNPSERITVDEALRHPFIMPIVEELHDDLSLPDEAPPYFDFEDEPFDAHYAQALLVEQVLIDNPQLIEQYHVTPAFAKIMERRERILRTKIEELVDCAGHKLPVDYFRGTLEAYLRKTHAYFHPHSFTHMRDDTASEEEEDSESASPVNPEANADLMHANPVGSRYHNSLNRNDAFTIPAAAMPGAPGASTTSSSAMAAPTLPAPQPVPQAALGHGALAQQPSQSSLASTQEDASSVASGPGTLPLPGMRRTASQVRDLAHDNRWSTLLASYEAGRATSMDSESRSLLRANSHAQSSTAQASASQDIARSSSSGDLIPDDPSASSTDLPTRVSRTRSSLLPPKAIAEAEENPDEDIAEQVERAARVGPRIAADDADNYYRYQCLIQDKKLQQQRRL